MKKTNEKKKPRIMRTVLVTTASCLTALTIFGFASGSFTSTDLNTPNKQEMLNNIMFLDPNCEYLSATGDGLFDTELKFLPSKKGPSYVILDKDISQKQRAQIETFLTDLNYIFTQINPNYKFEILDDYTFYNKLNANIILVKNTNLLSENHAAAHSASYTPTKNGLKTSFNRIYLNPNDDYSSKYSSGSLNFAHEFMHNLGLDDYYDENPYYYTIMGASESTQDNYFALNDLLVLKCKYGKINNLKEANDYINFACEYLGYDPENYKINERHDNFFKNTLPTKPILPPLPPIKEAEK